MQTPQLHKKLCRLVFPYKLEADMAHDPEDENAKILRARMLQWMTSELAHESDDDRALRKSLLAAIFVAPTDEPAVARFVEYLLTEFEPLAGHFSGEMHPFMAGHDIRRFDNGESFEMLVHKSLAESVMTDPITAEDIISIGLRLPWEVIAERFVGCFEIINYDSLMVGKLEDLEDLTDRLQNAIGTVEDFGPWKDEPEGPLHYPGCWIRYLHLSDRIFLFTRDTSAKSHIIVTLAAQQLFMRATEVGIGLRGGITAGECNVDFRQEVYAGQPLLDAQRLANRQAWFGVAFHPSTDIFGGDGQQTAPENVDGWIPVTDIYDIPFVVRSEPCEFAALNWAMMFRGDPDGLLEFLEPLQIENDPRLFGYYEEARRFGMEMIRRMDAET